MTAATTATDTVLNAYLLGSVPYEAATRLQRALVYHAGEARDRAALVLCEHPPLLTVGRHGGLTDLACDPQELRDRGWPVRWVNRGGGCLLHAPGQLAAYPVLPLDQLGLGLAAYVERLAGVLVAVLDDFGVRAAWDAASNAVKVGERWAGAVGVAVRDWIAYHGVFLNVHPDLTLFRAVHGGAAVTSLERERRGPVRPALVRERFLEHFARSFGFGRTNVLFGHPLLAQPAR